MRDVLAVEHPLEGNLLHSVVSTVHRLTERRAHSGDGEDAPAGGDDLLSLDLGATVEDDGRIVRLFDSGARPEIGLPFS